MSIEAKKLKLISRLMSISQEDILDQVDKILNQTETESTDNLNQLLDQHLENAKRQIADGQGVPHHKVREKYKQWL